VDEQLKGGRRNGGGGHSTAVGALSPTPQPEFLAPFDALSPERTSSASNLDRIEFQLTRTKEPTIDQSSRRPVDTTIFAAHTRVQKQKKLETPATTSVRRQVYPCSPPSPRPPSSPPFYSLSDNQHGGLPPSSAEIRDKNIAHKHRVATSPQNQGDLSYTS
jgi:hypothetical protein